MSVDRIRVVHPLFHAERGGSSPASTLQLKYEVCPLPHAIDLNRAWHSRLPVFKQAMCYCVPYCFRASCEDVSYAVAIWTRPISSSIPGHWIELRRLAAAPDAPKNTCSSFLAWMVRWLKKHHPEHEIAISYQDDEVHAGTIYKAAGWIIGRTQKSRNPGISWSSSRRVLKQGETANGNGVGVTASSKIRWQVELRKKKGPGTHPSPLK